MKTLFKAKCPQCGETRPVVRMGTRPAMCMYCMTSYDEKTWTET